MVVAVLRLGLPAKPQINLHNLKGDEDYTELSSRFKGASVKILVWWLARESQKFADRNPEEPLQFQIGNIVPKNVFPKRPQNLFDLNPFNA